MALHLSCSPGAGPAGQRLAKRCRAEGPWQCGAVDRVRSQDVPGEPAIVLRGRTMPGELPGHHGLLHSARPGKPPPLFHQGSPKRGLPAFCCCLPRSCLPQWEVALAALVLWHRVALLGLHGAQHQAATSSCLPRGLSSSSCPREGGEGSRSDGACQMLGHEPGHGHQPSAPGGFKPLPVPRGAAPTLPIGAMRLLSLLLLLGLCCLWARLVSPGECGWARVGTGGCGSQWNSAAGGCVAMARHHCSLGVQHPTCAISPTSFHAAEMTTKPPTTPWESCLGSLEPSPLQWGWQMCPVMLQSQGLSMVSCLFQNSPRPHLDLDQGPSLCSQPTPDSQMTSGQLDSQPWRAPTAAG